MPVKMLSLQSKGLNILMFCLCAYVWGGKMNYAVWEIVFVQIIYIFIKKKTCHEEDFWCFFSLLKIE